MKYNKDFYKDIWFWLGLILMLMGIQRMFDFSNSTVMLTLYAGIQVIVGCGLLVQAVKTEA